MRLFKRCKHENTQTITNIFGDVINHFKGRRFDNCIDCGKEILKPELDFKCQESNQFATKLFYLKSHNGIKGVSDGDNTFNQLYRQIAILFAVLCNSNKEYSCKSWVDSNNNFKPNQFIVGITIEGDYYSMYVDKSDWELFQIEWVTTFPDAILLDNDNIDKFIHLFMEPPKTPQIGDVYEKCIYRRIVVQIRDGKYKIRTCYPDSLEHHDVDITWFDDATFIEHIKLK